MRQIVLDTETTGLKVELGDRLVEIGCVELVNHVTTGRDWHRYVNPEREVPDEAVRVHGLTSEFLEGHPPFARIADEFLAFVGDSELVIHNAGFDMGFVNAELERAGRPALSMDRAIDTVAMARKRFPGAPASLDALCRRFGIDDSLREKHGALIDARLLAEVYLELQGGRQPGFELAPSRGAAAAGRDGRGRAARPPRPHAPSPGELAVHEAFVATLDDPLWLKMRSDGRQEG